MKILFVSATNEELEILRSYLETQSFNLHEVEVFTSGIGSLSTCYSLCRLLEGKTYDIIIQAGICGSVSSNVELGSVINIVSDQMVDLGASSNEGFISFAEFVKKNGQIIQWQIEYNCYSRFFDSIIEGTGITANICHGDSYWVNYLKQQYPNSFESMEGAGFFLVTSNLSIPSFQIRAVSNYVEIRNKDTWQTELAIQNLNHFLIKLLNEI